MRFLTLGQNKMADLSKLDIDERKAIEDLRKRMKNVLSPEMYEDSIMFYRFLKARDFNVEKAEVMLKRHLKWRKVFQVDSILETMKPMEVFEKYFAPQLIGFDREGDLIMYEPCGKIDVRDIIKCMKINDFEKHCIHSMQEGKSLLDKENEKCGRNSYQGILIINLDQLTIANTTNKASVDILMRVSALFQENYPESLKAAFFINAPSFFVFIHSILKKIMSSAMIRKVHVFGRNGWKEALLKLIEASVLPAFLGGNRTDPDGNPLCLTFINHGGKVSSKYHLTNDERWFKDMSLVKKTIVPPLSKNTVLVDVKQCGYCIKWEFECKSKDIEFGLFFEDNEHEIEMLPMHSVTTSDGTETGYYKTEYVGKYHIVFDNSYSWLSSKEVHYTVKVVNPDS